MPIATTEPKAKQTAAPSHSSVRGQPMSVAAIIPAYNEESRVAAVLRTLTASPLVGEVIVVDDGSSDGNGGGGAGRSRRSRSSRCPATGARAGRCRKAQARTEADVLLFFDADLIGLKPEHIADLLAPVCAGETVMSMGIFKGGRLWTDMAQFFAPAITGQRAIRRDVFLSVPDLASVGYGIELAINDYVHSQGFVRKDVTLRGVTHPMKEEKLGWARGAASRSRMYWQMLLFGVRRRRKK